MMEAIGNILLGIAIFVALVALYVLMETAYQKRRDNRYRCVHTRCDHYPEHRKVGSYVRIYDHDGTTKWGKIESILNDEEVSIE